jgi:hypothetical protein
VTITFSRDGRPCPAEVEPNAPDSTQDGSVDLRAVDETVDVATVPESVDVRAVDEAVDLGTVDLRLAPDAEQDLDAILQPYQTAQLLATGADILQARRLHASVYLASGFVTPEDLAPDGTMGVQKDPWPAVSAYFAVIRGGIVTATARQICVYDPAHLPALRLSELDRAEVAKVLDLAPGAVVEISALAAGRDARGPDVTAVYSRMWRESVERRHQVWVMAVDRRLYAHLRRAFCGRALRPIGPAQHYLGSPVVPAVLWCDELYPEQQRMARSAGDPRSLPALLPRLFPPTVAAALR